MSKGKGKRGQQPRPPEPQPSRAPSTRPQVALPEPAPAVPGLDAAAISRFEEEERIRCRIKEEHERRARWWKKAWRVLNMPLSVFLLSTAIVTGGTLYYQYRLESQRKEQDRLDRRRRLALELAYRGEKASKSDPINARVYLNGREGATLFPELSDRSLQSLFVELGFLLTGEDSARLKLMGESWEHTERARDPKQTDIDETCKRISALVEPLLR